MQKIGSLVTENEVKAYLYQIGFTAISEIEITRKRNFIATFKNNKHWYILKKKGNENTVFQRLSLLHEMDFLAKQVPFDFLPQVIFMDTVEQVLVSRYYSRFKPLLELDIRVELGVQLAKSIAALHQADTSSYTLDPYLKEQLLPDFNWFTPETLSNGGPSSYEYIKLIQKFPDLLDAVKDLYATFEYNALIHGDFKADNILVLKQKYQTRIKLIDFEFTSLGDRHYDLGYLLGSFLMKWISNMKLKQNAMDYNTAYFDALRVEFNTFLGEYKQHSTATVNLILVVKYAGLFLLKTFYNCSLHMRELSKYEIMYVQIARNYLVFSEQQLRSLFL